MNDLVNVSIGLGIILSLASFFLLPFLSLTTKKRVTAFILIVNILISSALAAYALMGNKIETSFYGGFIIGDIPMRIDGLSGWFILIINFTILTGMLFGFQYLKPYHNQTSNITLHYISFILMHGSMLGICMIQNSLVFLIAWEIMSVSSFLLVIFEHEKSRTIKAGINYFIQSHVSVIFLTIAFIWVASQTNSYDFKTFTDFSNTPAVALTLFFCLFIGFAIKAGFVPFHTWLPRAHPAAPSHISGMMSGVLIKLGIYGILRMILLIKGNYLGIGYFLLIISVITGLYGVMLAIIQHNLKRLLAYHSIENIGIIGIGIGIGTIGLGLNNTFIIVTGFGGALLHTLNHSLFKSLLFYATGNIYQATHNLDIDKAGGLIKKMPQTGGLFLIAALAICGLPPLNGFISEFFIYSGLFKGLTTGNYQSIIFFTGGIFCLVIIGGLAMLCFAKAFGIVFLGTPRHPLHHEPAEANMGKLFPLYLVAFLIILIGIFPQFFITILINPILLFIPDISTPFNNPDLVRMINIMKEISLISIGFILLTALVLYLRYRVQVKRKVEIQPTWGCGYTGNSVKMQYTASSFVRTYTKLASPLLSIKKHEVIDTAIFPHKQEYHTEPGDIIEEKAIDNPLRKLKYFFSRFRFLQSGRTQMYLLYGVIFIFIFILFPYVEKIWNFLNSLINQL